MFNFFSLIWRAIMMSRQRLSLFYICSGLISYSFYAQADYASKIINPSDGYYLRLTNSSTVAQTPIYGSDGREYYQVGNPISVVNDNSIVSVRGRVNCIGREWGDTTNTQLGTNAYHRLFVYAPETGANINGKKLYDINTNVYMTIESSFIDIWRLLSDSQACSNAKPGDTVNASSFYTPRQITITFYVRNRIIDGQIIIPAMDLASYVRAFTGENSAPLDTTWSIGESTVPIRISASQLNIAELCTTTTSTGLPSTLNLRHGALNTINYDSTVTENVTYNCKFAESTSVRLRLDYTTDDDPKQRLPMTNSLDSKNKIYSELELVDDVTGQSGKDVKVQIQNVRTIKIRSHLHGSNAVAGEYKGSAWLIATFD
ncbi:adhesin [Providencia rettgeri]|nr:adhesin [Providencia rettgeri]